MAAMEMRCVSEPAAQVLNDGIARGVMGSLGGGTPRLSARREQVFRLLGQGYAPREIAAKFGVSIKTVQAHVERLKTQLGVRSQAELCRRAILAEQSPS